MNVAPWRETKRERHAMDAACLFGCSYHLRIFYAVYPEVNPSYTAVQFS